MCLKMLRPCVSVIATLLQSIVYYSKDDSTPEKASQNLPADTKKSDSMEEPAACQPSRRQTIKRCRLE